MDWRWCGLLVVHYCDVIISCLDSHSDGTHSLQRIHWWTTNVMLHFSKSVLLKKKKTHLHLGLWFQLIFNFGWTIPLTELFFLNVNNILIIFFQKEPFVHLNGSMDVNGSSHNLRCQYRTLIFKSVFKISQLIVRSYGNGWGFVWKSH